MFLLNASQLKAIIVESSWYLVFINMFNCQSTNQIEEDDDENEANKQIEEDDNDNKEANNQIEDDNDNEGENNQIEEDDDNENVNIPNQIDGDNSDVNNEGTDQSNRETPNLPNVIHQIVPSSKSCVVIDLEADDDS